ncbi:hypothetical protein [Tsuneonella amylolytica]|uniref:hypothetical protein n=1 Tax=Tsuneonella amylolytica TaxID=2338327 RepID=UPI0013C47BE1|nr:hypothetical protein [Tsuneonella amylolytica]
MTLSARGYGTVTDAPAVVVSTEETPPAPIADTRPAADVAAFVSAWAVLERNIAVPDRPLICTLEGTGPARGRVILREGCLKVAFAGGPEQPLLPLNARLFRDADGFLALGAPDRAADRSVRVGEPDASILVASCPLPDTVAPPRSYAKTCGTAPMVVAALVGRRPLCSDRILEERERMEREEEITARRIKAEADACKAAGRKACPPGVIPRLPPLTDDTAACRLPAGYRSSQGSSTQP